MTTKKVIVLDIIIGVLLLLTFSLFFTGLALMQKYPLVFYVLSAISVACLLLLIIIIVLNYKKVCAYTKKIKDEKIRDIEYSVVEKDINVEQLCQRLLDLKYKKSGECLYKKQESYGKITDYYRALIIKEYGIFNPSIHMIDVDCSYSKYNTAYIFLEDKIDENLKLLMEYVRKTHMELEATFLKPKSFFCPIIFAKNRIYFIEVKGVSNSYNVCLYQALMVLGINTRKLKKQGKITYLKISDETII